MSESSPNLYQFQLRTLFIAVTALAVVFAATRYGGWPWLLAAATLASLLSAHVVGNVVGTRLRDEVSPRLNAKPNPHSRECEKMRVRVVKRSLHERTPLGRLIRFITCGAALVGALLGGGALFLWTRATPAGWLVGTLSSSVVGGFVGFLLASFLEMTIRAWWHAAKRE
jgi:hypothetical protein